MKLKMRLNWFIVFTLVYASAMVKTTKIDHDFKIVDPEKLLSLTTGLAKDWIQKGYL